MKSGPQFYLHQFYVVYLTSKRLKIKFGARLLNQCIMNTVTKIKLNFYLQTNAQSSTRFPRLLQNDEIISQCERQVSMTDLTLYISISVNTFF